MGDSDRVGIAVAIARVGVEPCRPAPLIPGGPHAPDPHAARDAWPTGSRLRDYEGASGRSLGPAPTGVSCSFGAVTCLTAPRSVDELIEQADKLVYEAKRGGKDAILLGVVDGSA